MFQCLGLGTAEEGGCGEDWYHPGCLVGLGPDWYEQQTKGKQGISGILETITEAQPSAVGAAVEQAASTRIAQQAPESDDYDIPPPPGFPQEDDFDGFICYKCVDANPWIKRYAASRGFLEPVFLRSAAPSPEARGVPVDLSERKIDVNAEPLLPKLADLSEEKTGEDILGAQIPSRKRKADDEIVEDVATKRVKDDVDLNSKSIATETTGTLSKTTDDCKYDGLAAAPEGTVSLFFKSDFREHLCRCPKCFPLMAKHSQLLDEEENYEPPVSESDEEAGGSTVGSGSIYDRGESALKNVDRVRAIEGVMAYNHLKEKLTPFFKEFAESGKAISAEDIKAHFAKMRGDENAIKEAGEAAAANGDNRREESGY